MSLSPQPMCGSVWAGHIFVKVKGWVVCKSNVVDRVRRNRLAVALSPDLMVPKIQTNVSPH